VQKSLDMGASMADTQAMTRRLRTPAALGLTVLALIASFVLAPSAQAARKPTLVVTQLPAQVRLAPGETVQVTLSTNRTTGYSWQAKATGSAATVSRGTYQAPDTSTGMVGAPGTTTWTVKAVRAGTSRVNIVATPPGGGAGDTQTLTVIVQDC